MSPEYFKTELRPYEAEAYLRGTMIAERGAWERARLIVSPWRSEESGPIVFPWEDAQTKAAPTREEMVDLFEWGATALEQIKIKHGQE